jgi:4-amino-4-deoxy-L-arabinose transferase-like glycosyltransferase
MLCYNQPAHPAPLELRPMKLDQTPKSATAGVARGADARVAWSPALIALLLALIALPPRVLGLADFATTDEAYHWVARTERFANAVAEQRWAATAQTGHPGVTLMWLGSLGRALERLVVGQGWAASPSPIEHLGWLRLPGALLEALLIPAAYLLLRRLLAPPTALVAALLWATAPYLIAHARLLHLDALLTSFVTFSVLLLLVATKDEGRRTKDEGQSNTKHDHLVALSPCHLVTLSVANSRWSVVGSGVCAGLALLTKGPALILLPFAGLLLFFTADNRRPTTDDGRGSFIVRHSALVLARLRAAVPLYLLWLGVALLVVVLLWPALWVDPSGAFRNYLDEIISNGGRPNGAGQFFLGSPVGDPGPLFYPIAELFRMTPLTLIGLLALPLALRRPATGERRPTRTHDQLVSWPVAGGRRPSARRTLLALGAFVLFWMLVMTLGPKKFDRYVLPTWPAIEALAAAGLIGLYDVLPQAKAKNSEHRTKLYPLPVILCSLLLILTTVNLAWYHPYYLSYYNPLLGGGASAQRALLIGWGEGMDQVGAYLRQQPDITQGPVLSALGATLQPFVPAPVRDVSDLGAGPANYAVVYLESTQRADNQSFYTIIQQTIPLRTISIHSIEYARIYQLPRPFERAIGARWGAALRLAGVTIARSAGQLMVTPAWDVRATPAADYQVFLHMIDARGQRVAQIDVAPGGADFPPTSAWQPGRQIAVPLPLPLPEGLPAGEYRLVMGLYDSANTQRPPLDEGMAADPALDGPSVVLLDTISLR